MRTATYLTGALTELLARAPWQDILAAVALAAASLSLYVVMFLLGP